MDYYQLSAYPSHTDSLKLLESDIQHANMLAASIPRAKNGAFLQMKLVYNQFAPLYMLFLQWMDCSCISLLPSHLNLFNVVIYRVLPNERSKITSFGRKATIREFYAVILPSLQRLYENSWELDTDEDEVQGSEIIVKKKVEKTRKHSDANTEREDECGICLEPCTKMVLPNCCHEMCINCYRDWNMRSESCPFCRGSLKRVESGDLWVLPCSKEVVDQQTVSREDLLRFYLYINDLPKDVPDALFVVYYDYLI